MAKSKIKGVLGAAVFSTIMATQIAAADAPKEHSLSLLQSELNLVKILNEEPLASSRVSRVDTRGSGNGNTLNSGDDHRIAGTEGPQNNPPDRPPEIRELIRKTKTNYYKDNFFYYESGFISKEDFVNEFKKISSPFVIFADYAHDFMIQEGINPDAFLAQFYIESQLGTDPENAFEINRNIGNLVYTEDPNQNLDEFKKFHDTTRNNEVVFYKWHGNPIMYMKSKHGFKEYIGTKELAMKSAFWDWCALIEHYKNDKNLDNVYDAVTKLYATDPKYFDKLIRWLNKTMLVNQK